MVDIFIIAYLMYFLNLQLIAGQLPETESLRNVTHCDINSALNIACGTDEVIALHSIKLAYNVKCETTCCNTYESSDCFAGFDTDITREFRRTCSGRQTCSVPSIQNTAEFCSFGVKPVSYVFLQYYCIPENRKIAICNTGKTLSSDGPPLYITSASYPDVTTGSTSCACSIEANSCSSSITLYEADIDLYLDTSDCLQNVVFKNGTDGVLTTIGCESYYTEYIISRTINSHYSKIDFINNSTANQEGHFFLGLKASEDGVSFSISCSSIPEHWCVGCGPLQNITNGILEPRDNDDTSYGAVADVSCNKGYETNTSTISCQANNTWQDVVCTAKDCGPAPTVEFGNITLNGTTRYGSTATVECQTGYEPNKTIITCLASGKWETPECNIKDCGPAQTVEFGNITLDGTTTFGSTATVECETGYQSNKTTVTCLASGQWETTECIIKDCGPAQMVDFGNITLDGTTTFGSTATVECETGYQPSKPKVTCLATGYWETAECNIKVSPNCPEGLESCLNQNGSYTCVVKAVGCCGPVPDIENGHAVIGDNSTMANVMCDEGHTESSSTITCLDSGEWEQAACTVVDCGPVPTVDFGNITPDGTTTFASTATVECETGYQPDTTKIMCLASGQWETPKCTITDCGPAPTVEFGNITLDGSTTFGSTATVDCETGYEQSKPKIACLASGQWETADCHKKVSDTTLPSDRTQTSSTDIIIIIVIVILGALILIQFSIVTFLQCKIYNIRKKASEGHVEMMKRVMVVIAGSVPVIGFIAIYLSGRVFYTEVYKVNQKYTKHTNETVKGSNGFNSVPPVDKSCSMSQQDEQNSEIHEMDEKSIRIDQINTEEREGKEQTTGFANTNNEDQDNAVSNPTYSSLSNNTNNDKKNHDSSEIHGKDENTVRGKDENTEHVNDTNLEGTDAKTHKPDYENSLPKDNAVSNPT